MIDSAWDGVSFPPPNYKPRRKTVEGCPRCEDYIKRYPDGCFPSHDPSVYCESNTHPHCTCDRCW
jgi:hypothetical protein